MAIVCAVLAVILTGLSKGGFSGVGALGMPLMVLSNSPVQSAAVMLPILILQDTVSVWSFRKSWDGFVLKVMMPGMTLGVIIGYFFSARVSESAVMGAVGAISVLFGLHRLWLERGTTPTLASNAPGWTGTLFGVVSGFTSHIAHAGGPPFQMWVLPRRLPRETLVGTSSIAFAYMNWIKVPAYIGLGQFTSETLYATALLAPVAMASTWAGVWLVKKVDAARFYTLIYALMVCVGGKLLFDGIIG